MRHSEESMRNQRASSVRSGHPGCYAAFLSLLLIGAWLIATVSDEARCCLGPRDDLQDHEVALVNQELDRPLLIGEFSAFSRVLDGADQLERRRTKTLVRAAAATSACSALSSLDTWERIETQGQRAIWRLDYLGGFPY